MWRLHSLTTGLLAGTAAVGLLLAASAPAQSAPDDLAISHVETSGDRLEMVVSVPPGIAPDDLQVQVAGTDVAVTAELADEAEEVVERTTILAFDTSNSMVNAGRFDPAKEAAIAFLDAAPPDVRIGLVTFDSEVVIEVEPTTDRDRARNAVEGLDTLQQTALNDGLLTAIEAAGDEGARHLLVLSDGKDTTDTPDEVVLEAIADSEVQVDVVALEQKAAARRSLENFADAGNGSVIEADVEALRTAFDAQAATLRRQLVVTVDLPDDLSAEEGTVAVTAGDVTAERLVYLRVAGASEPPSSSSSDVSGALQVPRWLMYVGLGGLGLGLLVLSGGVMQVAATPRPAPTAAERIAAYAGGAGRTPAPGRAGPSFSLAQAKDAAGSILRRNKGLEERISARLVAAGSPMKAAEWILMQGGIIVAAGLVGLLLGGDLLLLALSLLAGGLVPWLWLGHRRRKRVDAFHSGLADTLQLLAGSLTAGMSLAQAIDTVVQEGNEPIAGELRQVLVEARLGVPLEDALDDVARRFDSSDFAWVVMAIRVQRQVGGNLAELLTTVAATLREREYLRRQVRTLSAEGRMSGWILGLLPVAMFLYLLVTRRDYVQPLYTEFLGILMLAAAVVMLALGAFVISKIVKVEV